MPFKPFFIHFNRPAFKNATSKERHSPRGFTAYISPGTKPREVSVQATFCSHRDEFVKKLGRELAMKAEVAQLNPRDLPKLLAAMTEVCQYTANEKMYMYVLKYVV